ncbi:MAG: methyltransferase domain-containing protein [Vulcanimicrobiaceae bacterium]
MDDPAVEEAELEANFAEIEFANRYFGGIGPVVREVFARGGERLLDVGCGSADIPRALLRRADRCGRPLTIVALDRSETALAIARRRAGEDSRLRFVRGDGERLPFPDGSFDLVTCNLALHHFEPAQAIELLRELRRVARESVLICDLRRSLAAYAAARAYVALLCRNRLTKHDAPLSVRRAYTPEEALELARRAGWANPRAGRRPFFRMMLCDG